MMEKQQSLTYEELSRANRDDLERLAEAGLLDDATRARCAHWQDFSRGYAKRGHRSEDL